MADTTYTLGSDCALFHADCRDALKALPDNCVDAVVTDPPYALVSVVKRFGAPSAAPAQFGTDGAFARQSRGFMGKVWDSGEVAFDPDFWAEVLRVLKPGGHVVAMGGTRTYHHLAMAIEMAGFEVRDSLMWVYGQGFPKSHSVGLAIDKAAGAKREVIGTNPNKTGRAKTFGTNGIYGSGVAGDIITAPATAAAKEWEGWGTALKPAFEPIVLARKPLSESTVAANVLKWRTGALNIGACRVAGLDVMEPRHRHGGGIVGNGSSYELPDSKGEIPSGRWPANLCHDGSAEVLDAFPSTQPGASAKHLKRHDSKGVTWDHPGGQQKIGHEDAGGSAARFFYSAKASRWDRAGSKHPTVKPVKLMEWLTRLVTPPGGVILDPFAGSGTTGQAALQQGFKCLLVEREAEYVADICRRLVGPS